MGVKRWGIGPISLHEPSFTNWTQSSRIFTKGECSGQLWLASDGAHPEESIKVHRQSAVWADHAFHLARFGFTTSTVVEQLNAWAIDNRELALTDLS